MDAAKLVLAKGDKELNISDETAVCSAIASALRDMADEIESGDRVVNELQTQEMAHGSTHICSALYLKSTMQRKK